MTLPSGRIERWWLGVQQLIFDFGFGHRRTIGGGAQQLIDGPTHQIGLVYAQGTDDQ